MKKVFLSLALVAFVGATTVSFASVSNDIAIEKNDDKKKKKKKGCCADKKACADKKSCEGKDAKTCSKSGKTCTKKAE